MNYDPYTTIEIPKWFSLLCRVILICLLLALYSWVIESDEMSYNRDTCYTSNPDPVTEAELSTCITRLKELQDGSPKEHDSK